MIVFFSLVELISIFYKYNLVSRINNLKKICILKQTDKFLAIILIE